MRQAKARKIIVKIYADDYGYLGKGNKGYA